MSQCYWWAYNCFLQVCWGRKGGWKFWEGTGLKQGPPFQGQNLLDFDGRAQHLISPLHIAKRALKKDWCEFSIFTQVERFKAHHRRAEPVKLQMRIRTRYGLTIPHFTQKGADWKKGQGEANESDVLSCFGISLHSEILIQAHISPTSLPFIFRLAEIPFLSLSQFLPRSQTDPMSLSSKNWHLSPFFYISCLNHLDTTIHNSVLLLCFPWVSGYCVSPSTLEVPGEPQPWILNFLSCLA